MRVLYVFTKIDRGECYKVLEMHERGIEVFVACQPDAHLQEIFVGCGIPVYSLSFLSRRDRQATAELRNLLETIQPDIVHVFTKLALSNALVAIKGLQVSLIAYRGIVGNLSYLDPTSWMSFLNPRVDRIICVAEAVRKYMLSLRLFGLHIPPHKVITVHKGHEVEWYTQGEKANLSAIGIPAGSPVVGCVARMRPRKGVPVLIEAFEKLPEELGAHLVLIGKVEDSRISKAITKSPAKERIHLMGFRPDAAALAGALDVFVLPSLRREGLPRAVIEAMAQRIPVIVTDSGGSPELLEDFISGRIVPPNDAGSLARAMEQILTDPVTASQYGIAAQERIKKHFNVTQTVEKTLTIYRELLSVSANANEGQSKVNLP